MSIGAEIIVRSVLDETFAVKSGQYFDNDIGDFGPPHVDAQDKDACVKLYQLLKDMLID
ncbi:MULTISPECIES: hypothetical protein [unclassified Oleiphilus]|uniref:hypothetical protein n=1 Tax=unclassified Oleiphilus TaxID=2631174 RepID=UPI000AA06451|nr:MULTISPECIES: hypothetical protein [unclassified Oleiphilus]MCH2158396.1 hypothetical protein [Oleiphilaceae bacterium]